MLSRIIHFSIHNKLIVGLFMLAFVVFGIVSLQKLPIDAVPDITDNQVQIITSVPALAAPEVERLITFPIEQAAANIPGILEIRSFSRFGLSLVTIVFSDETEIYWARQQVSERLAQVQSEIPAGSGKPILAPVTTGLGEIFQYVVRPKPGFEKIYSPVELRTIQDWIVRRQLLGVPGVADVSSFGGKLKQYEIAVHPDRLKAQNLTIEDIFEALEKNNQNTGGAYIERGPTVLFIRSEGLLGTVSDIENVPVKITPGGIPLTIKDLAEVRMGSAVRYGAVCFDDEGEVAGAVVMMLKGENSSKVIKNVKDRIAQIEKTLPDGVLIEPFLDRTKMVNNAISTVQTNLLEGALIVLFVLVLFLGNLRAGLLVASVIPLSMLFAVIMMNFFGVSGNLMSLGALDFGLIIDGAVIIVEAVLHQLSTQNVHSSSFIVHSSGARPTQIEMDDVVKKTTGTMMNSAVFGQIIILIVYLPILSLQGIEGKMFAPMAQTVAFALLGAFILSLTYVPKMSALLLRQAKPTKPNWSDRAMFFIGKIYQKWLAAALSFPKTVVGAAVVFFVAAFLVMQSLGGEFIPELEEGDFAVDTRVLPGSSLATTIEGTQKTAKILLERFPEVIKIVTKIGSGEIPTDPMPIEASDMMVILKDKKDWTSAKTFDELAEKMSIALEDVPGVTAGFQYPVQMRFNELMTGAKQDVVCKIFGENLDTLAFYAQKLGAVVGTVDGAVEIQVETVTGLPQIVVNYDRAAIARFGLNISDINRTLQTAFAGASAGLIYEGEKRFDLVVRLAGEERKNLEDVRNLLISSPLSGQIPLSQVAKVDIIEGPSQIQREDAKRRITVGFNVRGRDIQTVVHDLQAKTEAQIKFPPGYFITFGGQFENLLAAKKRLAVAVPVALLLIFLLLYFAFGSIRQGLLIFTAIPMSAIGGVFALWLRGMPFSISAGVGFIALFGVAVLNGIVLIAECNRLSFSGNFPGKNDLRQIIKSATANRLRPVLMTAAVASLGFLPMALSNGSGAEVQRPLATVVIGGLFSATLLTLFVLPILYVWFEKITIFRKIKTAAPLLVFIFSINVLSAQHIESQPISLENALKMAAENNLALQTARLKINEKTALENTARDLPKTQFGLETGQINSRVLDNRLSANQSFRLPKYYRTQAGVLKSETEIERRWLAISEREIQNQVRFVFYELLFLEAKKQVLQRLDSLFLENIRAAELRLKTGESSILEKISAENQRAELGQQLRQTAAEIEILQTDFQFLLQTDRWFLPEKQVLKMKFEMPGDPAFLQNHPKIALFQKEIELARQKTEVSRAELLPEFSAGYALQSIRGTQTFGSRDFNFNAVPQFSALQIGVEIPLFKKAKNAKTEAARLTEKVAESELKTEAAVLQNQFSRLARQLENARQNLEFYEKTALPQAENVLRLAKISRQNGEIGQAEFALVLEKYVVAEQAGLEAARRFNLVVLEITGF